MYRFALRRLAMPTGLLGLALAVAASAIPAQAQVKAAVINIQKAISDTDELKKASADLEAKYKPEVDKMQLLANDLQSIQDQLSSGKLKEDAAAELQAQGQRKQRDLQRMSEAVQAKQDKDRQDILGKFSEKMQTVVNKLAEEKGLDVILEASQTLYVKPAIDVTADATAAYNKANPAK